MSGILYHLSLKVSLPFFPSLSSVLIISPLYIPISEIFMKWAWAIRSCFLTETFFRSPHWCGWQSLKRQTLTRLEIVTKAKQNRAAFKLPVRKAGRGGPPQKGEKVILRDLFSEDGSRFTKAELELYGKQTRVEYLYVDLLWGQRQLSAYTAIASGSRAVSGNSNSGLVASAITFGLGLCQSSTIFQGKGHLIPWVKSATINSVPLSRLLSGQWKGSSCFPALLWARSRCFPRSFLTPWTRLISAASGLTLPVLLPRLRLCVFCAKIYSVLWLCVLIWP